MSNDPIYSVLRASLEEQVAVVVYVKGNALEGIVRSLDEAAIELDAGGRRTAVRWLSIDAVELLPHEDANDDEKKTHGKKHHHRRSHGHHDHHGNGHHE